MKVMSMLALALLTAAGPLRAEVKPVPEARVQQLKDLRWGMFVCWSFSTFSGKEWTPGVTNVDFFKATEVDTDQWARSAKEAGMGYILFLTKHHDGFCLWDTKTTDRKVTKAPLGRDVLAELKKSCEKHGIKLALYFSEGDWTWEGSVQGKKSGPNPEMKKAQLKELLTQYGPIEYIWFDHAVGDGGLSHAETIAFCKALQPDCFVGFNHGDQEGADIRLGEMGKPGPLTDHAAAGPHMRNAPAKSYRLAEFTYPILPPHKGGAMWFYSLPMHDALVWPAAKLYRDYLGAVKHGNVFALDVGPDYRGRLRDIDVKTLREVGDLIRANAPMPESAPIPTSGVKARASSEWGSDYDADKAVDGDEGTRWGAKPESRSGWLEVDLGKETEIGRAVVMEIGFPRTQQFAIECRDGDAWKPLVTGTTIAGRRVHDFAPVKARVFRLNILKAGEVPSIEEFQLLAPGAKLPEALETAKREEEQRAARTQWFREAKFGMFITWGLYSVPAGSWKGKELQHRYGEWIEWALPIPHAEYAAIADTWNPQKFDADAWVKTAKDAGMKYLLLTAKFHDGFLMYPSKITDYNIHDRTPWKRNPVRELSEACARQGLKFGVYWNHVYDWQHPDAITPDAKASAGRNLDKYIDEVSLPQLREMLVDHPLISFIWFDQARGTPEMTFERGRKFADLVRSIRPDLIFNSRLGGYPSDYTSMGDNALPSQLPAGVWESPCTINHTWGFKAQDTDFKSAGTLLFNLVDIVSKGGNYILNVGPTGDGEFPAPEVERLKALGAWLAVNGEAIYGAGRTPFGEELGGYVEGQKDDKGRTVFQARTDWRCTTKPSKLYITLFKWPAGRFELDGLTSRVTKAYLLADAKRSPLEFTQNGEKLSVVLPGKPADELATVLCLEVQP